MTTKVVKRGNNRKKGDFLPKGAYVLPSQPGRIVAFVPATGKTRSAMLDLFIEAAQLRLLRSEPTTVMFDPTGAAIFGYLWNLDRGDVTRFVPWLYAKRHHSAFAHKLAATVLAAYDVSEAAR
jgi:hypothetical protein